MRSRGLAALILWLGGAVAVSAQQPPAYSTQSIAGVLQPGDGGPAIRSFVQLPAALAVDPSGTVYIGQTFGAIRRVAPDGTITTIAGLPDLVLIGAGAPASTGDGGPAISAGFKEILGLALDGASNLYVSDVLGCRIRRINLQTGAIDNYAGQNGVCTTGADGPVATTSFNVPTHVDYSLVGPQAISAPGYPFTPAKVGETIVLYITGLGLPSAPLVNGSATQYGAMPSLPVVQFGTAQATVSYAYVVGPGTYQVGVVVPAGAAIGDNSLSVSYGGATTPLGALLTVQP